MRLPCLSSKGCKVEWKDSSREVHISSHQGQPSYHIATHFVFKSTDNNQCICPQLQQLGAPGISRFLACISRTHPMWYVGSTTQQIFFFLSTTARSVAHFRGFYCSSCVYRLRISVPMAVSPSVRCFVAISLQLFTPKRRHPAFATSSMSETTHI
jgi:hypothetical protein